MIATSLRSMPRLITISPMPSPRMPRMEMLRTRLSRLATLEKPGSVRLNTNQQRDRDKQHDLFLRRFLQQLSKQTADGPTLTVSRCIQRHGNAPPRTTFPVSLDISLFRLHGAPARPS